MKKGTILHLATLLLLCLLTIPALADDSDGDGAPGFSDNCLRTFNPDQLDCDGDGVGDACEALPGDADGRGERR